MINFLPLWERGASPALLSSCRCSSWCRSQMEWSQSCQHAPRDVYVPSDPAWSPKSWGNSRHPKTWSSDTGPIESNKSGLWKVSCIMEIAGLLSVSMRHTMRSTGSYIVQSMIFAMSLFFFYFLQNINTVHSNLLCLYQSYPFGDEISTQHQVILRNSTVAWENWEKPAPRKEQTKSVIQQHYTLISATMLNYKIIRW